MVDTFAGIDEASPLDVEDLERLAEALDLVGRGDDAITVLQRVYAARVDAGDVGATLRDAFWLYRALAFNAEFAQAAGWIARAARLTEGRSDCAQQGYLLLPEAERELRYGDYQAGFATAGRAAAPGTRCGERDVVTIAAHLQGRADQRGSDRRRPGAARRGDAGHQRRRDVLPGDRLDLLQDYPNLSPGVRRAPCS